MRRFLVFACLAVPLQARSLPIRIVTHEDTVITQSCEIVIPPGTVIVDANTNGVLHLAADHLTVRFAPDTVLRGAPEGTPWDMLNGIGIRINGHRNVHLVNARVHGFFNGVVATHTDQLEIAGGDFSDNYRQHLRSTPAAEDSGDWLFPHHNDETRWRDEYGGAVCVEQSRQVTIHDVRVRRGQNGLVLDRVDDSRIYDNDCSFLSGWGLALWRSSRNTIARNALDFCVRGHVEGVYNRGQDSAGILCFEQCNDNVFAENSVTHGGDGFFGFAGREAVGDAWLDRERERLRRETGREKVDDLIRVPPEVARDLSARGCNGNRIVNNDFSYAPAHGLELTFSEHNLIAGNRFIENAICGIWGGYSSDTLITGNEFRGNGGMAYGLERGAINMEHASDNRIVHNRFINDKCAIHLWWDDDGALLRSPGVAGNDRGASENLITGNSFVIDARHPFTSLGPTERLIVLQLRDDGTNHLRGNRYFGNTVNLSVTNAAEFAVQPGCEPLRDGPRVKAGFPNARVPGRTHPVGARARLAGRDQIIMDEWGPWDHESPLVRPAPGRTGEDAWEILGVKNLETRVVAGGVRVTTQSGTAPDSTRVTVTAGPGVTPYRVELRSGGFQHTLRRTIVAARWETVFFPWMIDPRENLPGWRQLATGAEAVRVALDGLELNYGWRGPRDMQLSPEVTQRGPGPDHFGMIARTTLPLPAGSWRFSTLSDDGVRVTVNGHPVIENWAWHGPTHDAGVYEQAAAGEVAIEVEHFEIDGYATLSLQVEPAR